MKFLFVGDPHARVSNLEEMHKLVDFLCALPEEQRLSLDFIFLAGDLFNDHAVVRLEVAQFWRNSLKRLAESYNKVITLVGNHDMIGTKQMETGMSALNFACEGIPKVWLIDKYSLIGSDITAMPYMSNEDEFVKTISTYNNNQKVLLCHQTFNGALYDNGFYAPGGFDTARIPHKFIISGHIHTEQSFGKVWYPGTARWETRSDANLKKGVWIVDVSGEEIVKTFIPTDKVVTPIVEIVIREGDDLPGVPENTKLYVELVGTSEWIKKTKEKYRGLAAIKCTPKDIKTKLGSKARGMTLDQYLTEYFDTTLVSKEALRATIQRL